LAAVLVAGAWAQAPQKNYKDRAEYDLYSSILKETNAQKKLELLNQWKEKYPATEFNMERLELYLAAYQGLNKGPELLATAKEILAADPKNMRGLYWVAIFTLNNTTPEQLDTGQKAAEGLLANVNDVFAPDKKPAAVADDAWKKERANIEILAQTTLGWVAYSRKENDAAAAAFKKALEMNPVNAQVSYWMGSTLLRKAETQGEGLYHIARASIIEGQGALDPATKNQLQAYLQKVYAQYHGDSSGLDELKAKAKDSALVPADFKIKRADEVAAEKEAEFRKTNPAMALWMSIKKELTGPNSDAYFAASVKDAHLPGGAMGVQKFRGKLIEQKPARNPKELVLGMSDATTAEVTLKLETAFLPGRADPGTEIEFEGVVSGFTKDPFMVTVDLDKKEQIAGWPAQAAPAKKAGGAAKKAAPAAKKATTKK
jgi:tetratricopeptide (TPR) repeat protein